MAISLQKGQKIDLTKGNAGLSKIIVGLGWDVAAKKGGFFGFGGGGSGKDVDCDASVVLLSEQGKITKKQNLVYFGNKESACKAVRHSGDNVTGEGAGDDEQVFIDLNNVAQDVHKISFVVNIYQCVERKQDFGMIKNAYIRIVDGSSNAELARFNLTDEFAGLTTLFPGEIYRHSGEWKFSAIGEGTKDTGLAQIMERYQ